MIAASDPRQRRPEARLLVVDGEGELRHFPRSHLVSVLRPGDLLVANDAATLPASLVGHHVPSGDFVEVRLAGRRSMAWDDVRAFTAVVLGPGDHTTPTERRPDPPPLSPGDDLTLGPLRATVTHVSPHPRLVTVSFHGSPGEVWDGIGRHGAPIQYAHVPTPLSIWDTWTRVAAQPVSFEAPSASFVVDWALLASLEGRGIQFGSLTHAAGLSSTGDPAIDALLPFDEAYRIPASLVRAIHSTRVAGGRVVALGTTVTRALEHAASNGGLRPGTGVADQRIGPSTELQVVDAIVSGVHDVQDSHYDLLRAFVGGDVLDRMTEELTTEGYLSHEFGDSVLVQRKEGRSALRRVFGGPVTLAGDPFRGHRGRSSVRQFGEKPSA